jgi:hypothetical protein
MATGDEPVVVGLMAGVVLAGVVVAAIDVAATGSVVLVVGATLTGVESPGRGVPATSPAPVALSGVTMGTPGAGGSGLWGGIFSSWRASLAIVANVGADAAAP